MAEIKSSCFVIMPFSNSSEEHTEEYWTQHFKDLLKPTIEKLGVKVYRVESIREDIIKKIISSLVTSSIVVADLTDHNPNVFWELGVRQSFKHNTITIAEKGTELPFDVSAKATIFYDLHNEETVTQFKTKLIAAIEDCIANPEKSDSHVLESISGRGSLYEIMRMDDARRRVESLVIEAQNNQKSYNTTKDLVAKRKHNSSIPSIIRFRIWRTKSLERILVYRYLDEDVRFYRKAEVIMRFLENMQLRGPWINMMDKEGVEETLDYYRGKIGNFFTRALQIWIDTLEKTYQNIMIKMQTMISETGFKSLEELRPVITTVDKWITK